MTVQYNHLNLPVHFEWLVDPLADAYRHIWLTYGQTGQKLRKQVVETSGTLYTQDYVGGLEYRTNAGGSLTLEAIYHAEGRITPNASAYRYEYTIKDHLGNARISFADLNDNKIVDVPGDILQENHYYPFGLNMNYAWMNNSGLSDQKYLYNGKELNDDFGLNLSDYGARWYDAAVGRWWSVDPLAEEYFSHSPYNYTVNNPMRFIDPDGSRIFDRNKNEANIEFNEDQITINNANELDANLVNVLINTFLEGETGEQIVKDLVSDKRKYQITVSDKAGMVYDKDGYRTVWGLTVYGKIGYDAAIFLFNTEKKFDIRTSSTEDFDFVNDFGNLETEKHKKKILKDYKAASENKKTKDAIAKLTESQREVLRLIAKASRANSGYGYISVLIHEAVHAQGDREEYNPRIQQIKAFCECNEDCPECD
jgi:RHS repeat-associated protein